MSPENLIKCTKLYDHYTNGFGDGQFNHRAHVHLLEIVPTTEAGGGPHHYSAPLLMDLINDVNISPLDVSIECLEAKWFEQSNPYDLAEPERVDAENPDNA